MVFCRGCGKEIHSSAPACPQCGAPQAAVVSIAASKVSSADYGLFLLAIPVVATLLIWFWVSGMNLFQSPGSTLTLIMFATVLGTAMVAAMEASRAGMKSDSKKGTYSPTAWFFIVAMMWIIGYPAYMFKRRHYGLDNRLVLGTLVALIFFGSGLLMSSAIEETKAKVRGDLEQAQRTFETLGR